MRKHLFSLLAARTLGVGTAQARAPAQEGGRPQASPGQMAARQTERMTQALSLTANQATEVQQILAARDQEMLAMRGQVQSGAATRDQVREQMHIGHAEYDA